MTNADFQTLLDIDTARKSPEALVAYLGKHFPARWFQCVAPNHRFWDAPCAQVSLGETLVMVTFAASGCAVDLYPNVMPQRYSVNPLEFAKELRAVVKVAAAQDSTIVLPEWAV